MIDSAHEGECSAVGALTQTKDSQHIDFFFFFFILKIGFPDVNGSRLQIADSAYLFN